MYIAKDSTDTLIIRGYSWHRFAAALIVFLLTPLWVWLALKVDLGVDLRARALLVIFSAIAPFLIFATVKRKYKDWLLVFETDYDLVGFYELNLTKRKLARRFALSEIENAKLFERTLTHKDANGRQTTTYTYHLTLNTFSDPETIDLVEGEEVDIYRMQSRINGWLESHRRRQLAQSHQNATPLDSPSPPA